MTTKICSKCGTSAGSEIRFCRSCGASLKNTGKTENSPPPLSATVPVTEHTRPTDGTVHIDDPSLRAAETVRVQTGELDELLRDERVRSDGQNTVESDSYAIDPEATLVRDPSATSALSTPNRFTVPVDYEKTASDPVSQSEEASALSAQGQDQAEQTDADAPTVVADEGASSRWWQWAVVGASLIVAAAAIFLVARSLTRPSASNANIVQSETGAPPPTLSERLADAEQLLATGEVDGAIKNLREAVALDPANAEARHLLGDALMQAGKRSEAIEEYRQASVIDPQNKAMWAKLASAQFAEGRYREAADSYERLAALSGDAGLGDEVQLQRADALRLANRTAEAKAIYERLSASSSASIAGIARNRLGEISAQEANQSAADERDNNEDASSQSSTLPSPETVTPSSSPPLPPPPPPPGETANSNDPFVRGESLWRGNRAAAVAEFRRAAASGNADAYYYLGLNIAEGRDPRSLPRAELLAALQYFQNARTRGNRFREQARQYEERLNAEYGRRLGQ